jgi:hypothetical protein
MTERSETRDGMRIDWDVPITMDDGLMRADVFRPIRKRHPVILTTALRQGPAFQDCHPSAWQRMVEKHPDVAAARRTLSELKSSTREWVPHGYACVPRGAGCSPGYIDHFSPRETKDFTTASNGPVPAMVERQGRLNGISYYGINQWHVVCCAAAPRRDVHLGGRGRLVPRHDAHGGMLTFTNWYDMQVKTVQYGAGERVARMARLRAETLSEESLQKPLRFRRRDPRPSARRRLSQGALAAVGQDHGSLFSAANCIAGLHPRGNFGGVCAPREKWPEAHGTSTDALLYRLRPRAAAQVRRFLKARTLAGASSRACCCRWPSRKRFVARPKRMADRAHEWTRVYLNPRIFATETSLTGEAKVTFDALARA